MNAANHPQIMTEAHWDERVIVAFLYVCHHDWKGKLCDPETPSFWCCFPTARTKKKREENEFNSIYLLIYSLLSRKNQQTLGVSDNKITKKNICCLEGYTYIVCCEARKLFWHINREDILPERKKKNILKVIQILALYNISMRKKNFPPLSCQDFILDLL